MISTDPTESYLIGLQDLSHDSKLAEALGNMVVAWAHAENILLQVISRVTGIGQNMAIAGYYRIPTFESRTKFILAIISRWETTRYDKDTITKTIEKLGSLAAARNQWIHGHWCTNYERTRTVIFNHRVPATSLNRRKPIKEADVLNHCEAVNKRASDLASLIEIHSLKP
jgi:hypothetical protein